MRLLSTGNILQYRRRAAQVFYLSKGNIKTEKYKREIAYTIFVITRSVFINDFFNYIQFSPSRPRTYNNNLILSLQTINWVTAISVKHWRELFRM